MAMIYLSASCESHVSINVRKWLGSCRMICIYLFLIFLIWLGMSEMNNVNANDLTSN